MQKPINIWVGVILSIVFGASVAFAHCEVPCGIYDDKLRAELIGEHITTIEKAMKSIASLSKDSNPNYNQLVRWVTNKEAHATEIQHIVTQYFMTQRIKPGAKAYDAKLAVLHKLLVYAMKSKQSIDTKHIATLRGLLGEFEGLYFGH